MKEINLKSLHIQNFKGCKDRMIEFGDKTRISGANATGKTTVFDAFTWLLFGKDSLGSASFNFRTSRGLIFVLAKYGFHPSGVP